MQYFNKAQQALLEADGVHPRRDRGGEGLQLPGHGRAAGAPGKGAVLVRDIESVREVAELSYPPPAKLTPKRSTRNTYGRPGARSPGSSRRWAYC